MGQGGAPESPASMARSSGMRTRLLPTVHAGGLFFVQLAAQMPFTVCLTQFVDRGILSSRHFLKYNFVATVFLRLPARTFTVCIKCDADSGNTANTPLFSLGLTRAPAMWSATSPITVSFYLPAYAE